MQISGSVALVTGANRGLGLAFSRELVRRGAAKVYGAARNPAAVTEPGVLPVALDITDRRAVTGCQGLLVPRPGAHLPAHPGILGRRGQWHQLTPPRREPRGRLWCIQGVCSVERGEPSTTRRR
jgi:hypothetical protein